MPTSLSTSPATATALLDRYRYTRPTTPDQLWNWIKRFTGIAIARGPVCREHQPPWDAFRQWFFERPTVALFLGPRGGGKSFLSALDTHLLSRFHPRFGTRILGGSKAQSEQIYRAIREAVVEGQGAYGSDADTITRLLKTKATYWNGSEVSILAASSTSVRGPHVPSLKLDEVDEIDPEIREAAVGMAQDFLDRGHRTSILMTSTWHRLGGPMAGLMEQAKEGRFPLHQFCVFEVLERCPESRSGPQLERCPECPIVRWCHADRDTHPTGLPKAKRSSGHYSIDTLIQKVISTSGRVFEADYLCRGPRADGLWFTQFDPAKHVAESAEYDFNLPVWLSIDSGVWTAAVLFQVRSQGLRSYITVFAEFLTEGGSAESNARAIQGLVGNRPVARLVTDPAGGARNPVGPSVISIYETVFGRNRVERWPLRPVSDSLSLLESFLMSADGTVNLSIHPRCAHLVTAFRAYARAQHHHQWMDWPKDTQHPQEDMIDALRGGLGAAFPAGRRPELNLPKSPVRVLYG